MATDEERAAERPAARVLLERGLTALLGGTRAIIAFLRRRGQLPLAREVLTHWVAERATLRQGFVAIGLCIAGTIVAGVVLAAAEPLLEDVAGLLTLVPGATGLRGAIFAALGARLGTGMLTGQFSLDRNRRSFTGQNVEAAVVLTLVTSLLLAVLARVVAALLGQPSVSILDLVTISMVGSVLASVVMLAIVLLLARTAERRSWDMDAIGTPLVSASSDLLTLPSLLAAAFLVRFQTLSLVIGALGVALGLAAVAVGLRSRGDIARRTVAESMPVLSYAATFGIFAGIVLQAQVENLSQALLVAVPAFIATCGAIGGILSARLSSSLHLGLIRPRPIPERAAGLEGSLTVLFGLVGFATVGLLAYLTTLVTGYDSPGALRLAGTTLTGGLLAVGLLFVVGYSAATASYRFGLDPDNVSIPVVTATMDFFGILCLVAGISLFARI